MHLHCSSVLSSSGWQQSRGEDPEKKPADESWSRRFLRELEQLDSPCVFTFTPLYVTKNSVLILISEQEESRRAKGTSVPGARPFLLIYETNEQLLTTDILVPVAMKNAAKCDT